MSKAEKKNPLLHANCTDCCHHESDADNPAIVMEITHSDGALIYSTRQCSICNTTAVRSQPLPKDYGNLDKDGKPDYSIDRFYDWEKGSWEPVSKHDAYQKQKAKRLEKPKDKGPDDPTDVIEG